MPHTTSSSWPLPLIFFALAFAFFASDSGVGMSAEVQRRIFEPFFTTKKSGTGLGLPVARQIIEAHGGTLECESAPGEGTTFIVRLPSADAASDAA